MKPKVFQEDVEVTRMTKHGTKRLYLEKRNYIPEFRPFDNSIFREFLNLDWSEVDPEIDLHTTPHHLYQDAAERWTNFGLEISVDRDHLFNINLWKNYLIEKGILKAN